MDDPAWVWPAWKFGLKRDDLFTTLHDQYNTFSYTLQDPEAFHHDVYEVSHLADTPEEFHRFLADRQRQRIAELRESLESLAVEIIANPKLMGTDQWQFALQLFRTKSFDSIVRYFASYLPEEILERHMASSITSSRSSYSETDSVSTKASSAADDDAASPFLDDFFPDGSPIIEEPCSIDVDDELAARPFHLNACSPSMGPLAVGCFTSSFARRPKRDEDENEDDETCPSASVCDNTDTSSSCDSVETENLESLESVKPIRIRVVDDEEDYLGTNPDDDEFPAAQYPEDDFCTLEICDAFASYDTLDSDTSAPSKSRHQDPSPTLDRQAKPWDSADSCLPPSLSPSRSRRLRSPSPHSYLAQQRAEKYSPQHTRRSPEEACSRIRKTKSLSPSRRRPGGSCSRSSSTSSRWLD